MKNASKDPAIREQFDVVIQKAEELFEALNALEGFGADLSTDEFTADIESTLRDYAEELFGG